MKKILLSVLLCTSLIACEHKIESVATDGDTGMSTKKSTTGLPPPPNPARVDTVVATANGQGSSPGAALGIALNKAIVEVNGATPQSEAANAKLFAQLTASLDADSAYGHDDDKLTAILQDKGFAERVVTESKGVVGTLRVLNMVAPARPGGNFSIDIEAGVVKERASKARVAG